VPLGAPRQPFLVPHFEWSVRPGPTVELFTSTGGFFGIRGLSVTVG